MCRTRIRLAPLVLAAVLAVVTPACVQRPATAQPSEFWAFTGPWDVESARSLREHGGRLKGS